MAFAPTYKEPQFINPPGASRRSRSSLDEGYLHTNSNIAGTPNTRITAGCCAEIRKQGF